MRKKSNNKLLQSKIKFAFIWQPWVLEGAPWTDRPTTPYIPRKASERANKHYYEFGHNKQEPAKKTAPPKANFVD
jgi:hypothetical protein